MIKIFIFTKFLYLGTIGIYLFVCLFWRVTSFSWWHLRIFFATTGGVSILHAWYLLCERKACTGHFRLPLCYRCAVRRCPHFGTSSFVVFFFLTFDSLSLIIDKSHKLLCCTWVSAFRKKFLRSFFFLSRSTASVPSSISHTLYSSDQVNEPRGFTVNLHARA